MKTLDDIKDDGGTVLSQQRDISDGTTSTKYAVSASIEVRLAAADWVEFTLYQSDGSSRDFTCSMSITRLGD